MKWYIRLFHNFMIYLPLLIIWSLILLTYIVYVKQYLMVLVNPNYNSKMHVEFFVVMNFPHSTIKYATFLFLTINWCIFWMMISMFRTVASDPGYLKDPITMEYNLVKMNLEFPESYSAYISNQGENDTQDTLNCQPAPGTNDSLINISYLACSSGSEEDILNFKKKNMKKGQMIKKKFKFMQNFGSYIGEGPLTTTESIHYRSNLMKFLTDGENEKSSFTQMSAVEVQNISPNDKFKYNYDNIFENFRGIDFSKIQLCQTCLRWKVERSHHCKQCGKCVYKMDHHCPWLANCIGFKNYKFFLLTIFYGFISSSVIFLTFWEVIIDINFRYDTDFITCCFITFVYVCNFAMLSFLSWLLSTNWDGLITNQTTIEKADKERFSTSGVKFHNYYDQGCFKNFLSVFGRNPLLWFFPIAPNTKGEGIIFENIN